MQRLHSLQALGVAPSTRRTYRAGVRHYVSFCKLYDIPPWPASETTLRYYCVHAYRTLSHGSIMVYLAGVRHGHLERGYADPTVDLPLLTYLCRGIRRHQGTSSSRAERKPISTQLLLALQCGLSQNHSLPTRDRKLLWAAITLGFYGFLRGGEFTTQHPQSYQRGRHLLRRDINMSSKHFSVSIKGSKTAPFGATAQILVAATGTPTCPVRAMREFLRATSEHLPAARPLFTLTSGKYLTRQVLTDWIRSLLQATGLTSAQAAHYSSHSLRIGAATEAAAVGLPDWLIQSAGRWRSEAYKRYIRAPKRALLAVAPALARGNRT